MAQPRRPARSRHDARAGASGSRCGGVIHQCPSSRAAGEDPRHRRRVDSRPERPRQCHRHVDAGDGRLVRARADRVWECGDAPARSGGSAAAGDRDSPGNGGRPRTADPHAADRNAGAGGVCRRGELFRRAGRAGHPAHLGRGGCAGGASYFVARAVPEILLHWVTERPPWFPTAPDWRVFAYLSASVALAGVAAGLAPAAESLRADILTSLKGQRSMAGATPRPRMHAVLVAGQVALGFILLSGAMLFLGTHYQTVTREVGYESRQVLIPRVSYSRVPGAPSGPRPADLRAVLSALPGTVSVAFAATAPGFGGARIEVARPGELPISAQSNEVSPGFFSAIALPIVRGRALEEQDRCDSARCAAVITEALAARLFPGRDAIGGALQTRDRTELRMVGVAADPPGRAGGRPDPPVVYIPWHDDGRAYQALVRFSGDAPSFAERAGAALRQRYAGSVVDTHTLRWPLDNWLNEVGGIEQLIVALGIAAAALAALGVFGVVSFAVSRREQEFGIRIALGATRAQIYAAVIQAGSRPVVIGLALGILVALLTAVAFTRVLGALQFTLSPLDPRIYTAAALPLAIVIAVALLIPARRATSVDPLRALKYE